MRSLGLLICVAAILLAVLPNQMAAQGVQQKQLQTYTVQDLGTLGGTFSWAYGINNSSSISGASFLSGDTMVRAFLWRKGKMTDLGTLGGSNSIVPWKPNDRGEVVGLAETSIPDTFHDPFCSGNFFGLDTGLLCGAFLWKDGAITQLPLPFGGHSGGANNINNRGQAVGIWESPTPESCFGLPFQFKPVTWQAGQVKELPLLPGDKEGSATGINDRGQMVGLATAADCTLNRPVLWEKGTITYMGSLGGTYGVAWGINNGGQAFGSSNLTGDSSSHAFLWQKGTGMTDLNTLPGDFSSGAWGIDDKGRVVGTSCDANSNCRAFLWEKGVMTDLNTLIPQDSPLFLLEADGINTRGQIVGAAFNLTTGELHAYLASPHGFKAATDGLAVELAKPTVVLPDNIRKLLQQRQRSRLGSMLMGPS